MKERIEKEIQKYRELNEKMLRATIPCFTEVDYNRGYIDGLRFALEVIEKHEAQPSEDCISRQAVLDVITFEDKWLYDAKSHNADTHIAFSSLESRVKALPSVTPQKPKGKWIEIEIDAGEFIYKCTKCGMRVINPYKYCPICGAEMGGADETN